MKNKKAKYGEVIAWLLSFGTVAAVYIMFERGITDGRLLAAPLLLTVYLLFSLLGEVGK